MKITIIGGGNMGMTYVRAFINKRIVKHEDIFVVEKFVEKIKELKEEGFANVSTELTTEYAASDIILVAVKPQDFFTVATKVRDFLNPNQVVLSIMAGITIDQIQQALNHKNVVRAMPNTPAQLGYGITAFTIAKEGTFENVSMIDRLFETTGKAIFLKDETLLDAVTALSGSGPAYFYYIVQHMIEAGLKMGVDLQTSTMLVQETMHGAFQILNASKHSIPELISMVKSKGGTTEAALNTFEKYQVGESIQEALQNAEKRAKELSAGSK
jgi:pyrroline-5-carboxylate reductase